MTDEQIQQIAAEVAKILAKDVYSDALQPGMKQIGIAIETVAKLGNTVLTPVALINDGAKIIRERIVNKWQEKMKQLPEGQVKPMDGEIAVPALKKLEYNTSEELEELFLNLLTSASNQAKEGIVHPSFANIISELSSDEARILTYLKTENQPICTVNIRVNYNNGTYSDHYHDTTIFDTNDVIKFKNNIRAYLENMKRLGLIKLWGNTN
ncbi:MAG: DUF4393 domain-containing protein [Saprospiraceae bacterium]|nr:DUF4393 domain-containing protein [Saprospiraceae bacterium]